MEFEIGDIIGYIQSYHNENTFLVLDKTENKYRIARLLSGYFFKVAEFIVNIDDMSSGTYLITDILR